MNAQGLSTILAIAVMTTPSVASASYERAEMMYEHGLPDHAKVELIEIIHGKAAKKTKAKALYLLGNIAFGKRMVEAALGAWKTLAEKYPKTPEAELVRDRVRQLAEVVGESVDASLNNAIASSYLRHAEFWSREKSDRYMIDSSWLPHVEMSVQWYDRVIAEFPKSRSSQAAHVGKIKTLLGWETGGRYPKKEGLKKDFRAYIPRVLKAFAALETEHPDAAALQPLRYQIAQAYWGTKDFGNTEKWLKTIISKAGDSASFYKTLAQHRLKKLKY